VLTVTYNLAATQVEGTTKKSAATRREAAKKKKSRENRKRKIKTGTGAEVSRTRTGETGASAKKAEPIPEEGAQEHRKVNGHKTGNRTF
jgi:hypothetical protein